MDTDGVPDYILSHFTPCLCKSSMFTLSVEGLRNLKRKRPPWPNMRSRMERKSVLFYPRLCTEWEVGMRLMRVCTLAGKGRRKGWRGQREREGAREHTKLSICHRSRHTSSGSSQKEERRPFFRQHRLQTRTSKPASECIPDHFCRLPDLASDLRF